MKKRGAFFDRDGVVNLTPGGGYVHRWEDFFFTPGIEEAIRITRRAGYIPVLVTNQRGVFTGETADLESIHQQMQTTLCESDAHFDAIYSATGDRDDPRRKPAPAMFFEAAEDLDLDLTHSFMIGDNRKDILAAKAASLAYAIQFLDTKARALEADYSVQGVPELCTLLRELIGSPERF